ncbi:hypothetical protein [Photobacterium kishitanii]|uniref:hypothetical protein n=1 Tax=Photobacterium kishitanii TaxID=318456 RepID=UPI001F4664ED|nr:hypothetical protein [Photobacterium kishitanii]
MNAILFFCDIGNSRILLSEEEVLAFQGAMQFFKKEYISRISLVEAVWCSSNFSTYTYRGVDIPLLSINRNLWGAIKSFARENDVFETDGLWSIFDSGSDWLKVYTKSISKKMEMGYHVFIKPNTKVSLHSNYTVPDDEVVLVWSPPSEFLVNTFNQNIGPRYYWDAKTSHDWLINELIPTVLEWKHKDKTRNQQGLFRNSINRFLNLQQSKRSKFCRGTYKPENYLDSFYREDLSKKLDIASSIKDALRIIDELQKFFAGTKSLYVCKNSYKALYFNLAELMVKTDMNKSNFHYVKSNLNYLVATDYQSLIISIREFVLEVKNGCTNTFQLDCLLRCYQSCLQDENCHINTVEIKAMLLDLSPVFELMNERRLLERQLEKL